MNSKEKAFSSDVESTIPDCDKALKELIWPRLKEFIIEANLDPDNFVEYEPSIKKFIEDPFSDVCEEGKCSTVFYDCVIRNGVIRALCRIVGDEENITFENSIFMIRFSVRNGRTNYTYAFFSRDAWHETTKAIFEKYFKVDEIIIHYGLLKIVQ